MNILLLAVLMTSVVLATILIWGCLLLAAWSDAASPAHLDLE